MPKSCRIDRLEQAEPVHAECDVPRFSFRRIVGIEFGRAQSSHMDQIDLATDIEFGTVDITIGEETYTLSLASALVVMEKSNANIVAGSKYSDFLEAGSISSKASASRASAKGGGIDAEIGLALPTSGKGGLGGQTAASWNRKSETTTSVSHRVDLVIPAGQDSWRVGGPMGNRLLETADLRGPAINSRIGDIAKPLCTLEAIDPAEAVSGRIRVQATLADFRLRGKVRQAEALAGIGQGLTDDQPALARRERIAETELKERVAALALLMPQRRHVDDGAFDLATRSFIFVPEIDSDGEA